jgi:hypothetical protein
MNSTKSAMQSIQPPTWFDLREVNPVKAFEDIKYYTDDLNGVDQPFINKFNDQFCNSHYSTPYYLSAPVVFGYIPAPPNTINAGSDIIKKVIGSNGHWFKVTTEKSGVHMIWYDKCSNNFLFWAPNRNTIYKAMKAIRARIIKCCEFMQEEVVPDFTQLEIAEN